MKLLYLLALVPAISAYTGMEIRDDTNSTTSNSTTSNMPLTPACSSACLQHAQRAQMWCGPYDLKCFCNSPDIVHWIDVCLKSTCSADQLPTAQGFFSQGYCAPARQDQEEKAAAPYPN